MYHLAMDALKLTACYKAFLVTADVPEIYMHQFWFTTTKIKDSSSYKFKLDSKSFKVGVEVFSDDLQICLRICNQEFVEPPTQEETVYEMMESIVYKTYVDFATGKVILKEARKRTKGQMKETSIKNDEKVPDVSKDKSSDQESENESWVDTKDDDNDRKSDDERTEFDDDKSVDRNKTDDEEEDQGDEFVHNPDDYVPIDDET
nr:hypothetical protein [Tanacetum cinerariifolium]